MSRDNTADAGKKVQTRDDEGDRDNGASHGTMTRITGRCGRHRHNVLVRRNGGVRDNGAGPRDNDPYHGSVRQTPAQRSTRGNGGCRGNGLDHGTMNRITGELAVPGTVARHATSPRHGPLPRLPTSCPGDSGLFARRQGQNPVVISLTIVRFS